MLDLLAGLKKVGDSTNMYAPVHPECLDTLLEKHSTTFKPKQYGENTNPEPFSTEHVAVFR